jgi:hypothetical protein
MTDVSTAAPPLFTVPSDRPMLDRELLTILHESNQPLDVDAIHDDINADRSRPHVARGPLETLIAEFVKAGKVAEVAHGQPARPHFVLVNEVRQQLDGSWQTARALAAIVIVLGEPQNRSRIQDISNALGAAFAKSDDVLPIPTPFLTAVVQSVDMNSPEAVDTWVATSLDALMRNGQVVMLPVEPPAVEEQATSDASAESAPIDTSSSEATEASAANADPQPVADSEAPIGEPEAPPEPNLHSFVFALYTGAWQRMVADGALAVATEAVPELVQQRRDQQGQVREVRAELEKLSKEFEVYKGVAEQRQTLLVAENKQLRTEQARFTTFCQDKGIDFALVVSGPSNERLHETHTIRGVLTLDKYFDLVDEHEKADRYAAILDERVKDAAAAGKAEVKEAKARVEALKSLVHSGRSNISGEYMREKGCIKYIKNGHLVWESDEPHDKGKIVDIQPIANSSDANKTSDEKKDDDGNSKKEKAKPVQLAIPTTARKGEIEWRPGDPVPDAPADANPTEAQAEPANDAVPTNDEATPAEPSTNPDEADGNVDGDDGAEELDESDDDFEDEDDDEDATATEDGVPDEATPSTPQPASATTTGVPAIDQASTKTFIRNYLTANGRSTVKAVSTEFARSVGAGDKPRVVSYAADIIQQLSTSGELDSEIVGDSEFVWLKNQTPDVEAAVKPGSRKGRGKAKTKPEV